MTAVITTINDNEIVSLLETLKTNVSTIASPTASFATVITASNSDAKYKLKADYKCTGTNDQLVIQKAIDDITSSWKVIIICPGDYSVSGKISLPSKTILYLYSSKFTLANGSNSCIFQNLHGRGTYATTLEDRAIEEYDIYIYGIGNPILNGNGNNQTISSYGLISLAGIDRFAIKNVTVQNGKWNGVECLNALHGVIEDIRGSDNLNCTLAIEAGAEACSQISVRNIHCENDGNAALWMSGCSKISVFNFYSVGATQYGIMVKNLDPNVGAANPTGINSINFENVYITLSNPGSIGIAIQDDNTVNDINNINIHNLKIASTVAAEGLRVYATKGVYFQNISVSGNIDISTGNRCVYINASNAPQKISNFLISGGRYTTLLTGNPPIHILGAVNGIIENVEVYSTVSEGIRIGDSGAEDTVTNVHIINPYVHDTGTFGIAVYTASNVHILNPRMSNTYGKVMTFRSGCSNCSCEGGSLSSTQTTVVENVTGNTDIFINCNGLKRTQLSDAGTRTIFNGVGLNAGNPTSTGDWFNYGYEGVLIKDTIGGGIYQYINGVWEQLA